ncbi:retrovirus-related Pol polyprotein from transposon opus [Trichonephila clavipes]|nr:retrovirus-related Pol polyprotein from transposon opus [Trichonephila clavipes]
MDKGIMVADSFHSEQEGCAKLALVWKHVKEGKGNYYEVDGYLFHRDKIVGESIGQLVIPKCRRTEVLRLAHTSVFSSHMGPKKTLERIKYSLFWEGLSSNMKKFCESCKECQLTRSVRIKDRSPITPVARSELPFEVGNMDLIGPIDPPSLKGHKYILCLVDQHTRWGEAVPLTSLSAKACSHGVQKKTEINSTERTPTITGTVLEQRGRRDVAKPSSGANCIYVCITYKSYVDLVTSSFQSHMWNVSPSDNDPVVYCTIAYDSR